MLPVHQGLMEIFGVLFSSLVGRSARWFMSLSSVLWAFSFPWSTCGVRWSEPSYEKAKDVMPLQGVQSGVCCERASPRADATHDGEGFNATNE